MSKMPPHKFHSCCIVYLQGQIPDSVTDKSPTIVQTN
ncbi:unnamed protein product [Acanthoscelides obtectus]|uniref:Uncharacterized protein n=1 Tax=Acanthoscelides obtectus TaxID=200917 RepID=A0A9P0JM49_ACAOB|nr:unnamed protein product [Acanthoscelides obtectus]CAK1634660.1 hypothetical protein AOBTE_LOCUS8856 [Acanthoscelides obtectus]